MALTPDEALRMFADAPPSQLFIDVDPDDWTEAYLAELASGRPSTVDANGRTIACRTARVDHDEHRVWLEPIGGDSAAQSQELARDYWTRPEVVDYVGQRGWCPADQTA